MPSEDEPADRPGASIRRDGWVVEERPGRRHLEALARAVADGVDVRRYCVWSLLDNLD